MGGEREGRVGAGQREWKSDRMGWRVGRMGGKRRNEGYEITVSCQNIINVDTGIGNTGIRDFYVLILEWDQ